MRSIGLNIKCQMLHSQLWHSQTITVDRLTCWPNPTTIICLTFTVFAVFICHVWPQMEISTSSSGDCPILPLGLNIHLLSQFKHKTFDGSKIQNKRSWIMHILVAFTKSKISSRQYIGNKLPKPCSKNSHAMGHNLSIHNLQKYIHLLLIQMEISTNAQFNCFKMSK